ASAARTPGGASPGPGPPARSDNQSSHVPELTGHHPFQEDRPRPAVRAVPVQPGCPAIVGTGTHRWPGPKTGGCSRRRRGTPRSMTFSRAGRRPGDPVPNDPMQYHPAVNDSTPDDPVLNDPVLDDTQAWQAPVLDDPVRPHPAPNDLVLDHPVLSDPVSKDPARRASGLGDLVLRPIGAEEFPAFFRVLTHAFNSEVRDAERENDYAVFEPERSLPACDGRDLVGTA